MKKAIILFLISFLFLSFYFYPFRLHSKLTTEIAPIWSMFRYNSQRIGKCPYDTAINNGTLMWKFRTNGVVHSSPAISSDGTVYTGSEDWYLYAIDQNGKLKWKYQTSGVIYSSPAISSDGTIYIGSNDHYLYAINPDGKLKWKFETDKEIQSSPAVSPDGTIYIGSDDHYLYAINPDGKLKWKFETEKEIQSSPAVSPDGTIYIGSDDHYLYAINPDGKLKWKYQTSNSIYSSPAVSIDGTVYVGSRDHYLYAVNPNSVLKWKFETGWAIYSSPAISSDGTIYIGSDDHYLYAINPDGKLKWKFEAGSKVESSPSISSDGTIYIGSDDHYLYAINPDKTIKWKFKVGDKVFSSPAIDSYGTIYIGSDDNYLYAIGSFNIIASVSSGGSISPVGIVSVNYGASQVFSIIPNAGYNIKDVIVDGVSVGAVSTYTFINIEANHTIFATFELNTYTVKASIKVGNGTVYPLSQVVNYDQPAIVNIVPEIGYHLDKLTDNGKDVTSKVIDNKYMIALVKEDHEIIATFAISTFTIVASAGESGSISPSGTITVNYVPNLTFTITPDEGYRIKDVIVDEVSVGAVSTYTFKDISSDHSIKAIFVKKIITIILQIGNPYMTVNGVSQEIDPGRGTKPIIKNARTIIPIRAIVEALGGTVEWDGTAKKVTITLKNTTIELWIGKPQAKVNGVLKWIDESNHNVAPEIINSRTMLPLRFVAENLGADVVWDGTTKTITITYTLP
jgi:outer membrane protein assembly factor BamB